MTSPFSLEDKTALVTAGSGALGQSVGKTLLDMGARVILTSRQSTFPDAVLELKDEYGERVLLKQLTFDDESVADFFADANGELGEINILINCAAGGPVRLSIEDTTSEDLISSFENSLVSSFLCAKEAVKNQDRLKLSNIINIGSIYGAMGVDHRIYDDPKKQSTIGYACAKGALIQMTRYFAAYWAPKGVRVNCVSPGGIERHQAPDFLERYGARIPMGRMVTDGEVTGAIAFLASEASTGITGENIFVDGGLHAW